MSGGRSSEQGEGEGSHDSLGRLHLEICSNLHDIRTPPINSQVQNTHPCQKLRLASISDVVPLAALFCETVQYAIDDL